MAVKDTETEQKEDKPQLTIENLPNWRNPKDNIPVFVAAWDVDTTMQVIEAAKHKVYYLIAKSVEKWDEKNHLGATVTRTEERTNTYKVVNNLIGRSISKADKLVPLWKAPRGLRLDIPKIPIELMDKIDNFFRRVYKDLGTEAVVVLTYDPNVGGPEGWGFVVPEQKNTAGSCKYDPPSVREHVPKGAFIAGSVHSHPGMSAFASHVDEGDQLDFDGVHITIGWSSKTNHETEHYIEIQMQQAVYELTPSQTFEMRPKVVTPEEELDEFMKNVSKENAYTGKASTSGTGYITGGGGTYNNNKSGGPSIPTGVSIYLPKGAPSPTQNLLIGVVDFDGDDCCPFCKSIMTFVDEAHRRCMQCMQLLMDKGEDIPKLIAHRKNGKLSLHEFENNESAHVYMGDEFHELALPEKF